MRAMRHVKLTGANFVPGYVFQRTSRQKEPKFNMAERQEVLTWTSLTCLMMGEGLTPEVGHG